MCSRRVKMRPCTADENGMTVYFEDSWIEDEVLDPRQEETIRELREALLKKDFARAKTITQEAIKTKA